MDTLEYIPSSEDYINDRVGQKIPRMIFVQIEPSAPRLKWQLNTRHGGILDKGFTDMLEYLVNHTK